jgi:hypothetical protein
MLQTSFPALLHSSQTPTIHSFQPKLFATRRKKKKIELQGRLQFRLLLWESKAKRICEERAHGGCVSICDASTGEFLGLHEPALLLYCSLESNYWHVKWTAIRREPSLKDARVLLGMTRRRMSREGCASFVPRRSASALDLDGANIGLASSDCIALVVDNLLCVYGLHACEYLKLI